MIEQNVSAAESCNFRGNQFACFDRLPAAVRHALHEGVINWSALESRWMLNKMKKSGMTPNEAVRTEVANLRSADEREVGEFAHHWPSRFGRLSPHVRAQATIMRYDEKHRHTEAPET